MRPFAVVSGDHNPIHTDRTAALLAGLDEPIVHGMWLSAAAQHVVTATDGKAVPPAKLIGWTARFLGMVLPGDEVDIRVTVSASIWARRSWRSGQSRRRVGDVGDRAPGRTEDGVRLPGQGIQHKGMGMEVRLRPGRAQDLGTRRRVHS